ncbi:MAG: penicillin-binding protein [Bacteroidales bacterium]|jgi:cell division protein FtsI (penicillin-binding protein 3)|nr:penicillin-binding protein [Bacteroidales bacterium]
MKIRKDIRSRLIIIFVIFVASMLLVLGQIFSLQFVQNEKWDTQQAKYESGERKVKADRGDILDCEGRLLAASIPTYKIYMDMRAGGLNTKCFYANIDSLSISLSHLLKDKSTRQYKRDLQSAYRAGKRYYRVTHKRLTYNEYKKIKEFPLYRQGKNKSGFIAEKYDERKLPFGVLASRTIGSFNATEGRGIVGIENAFDEYLKGVSGTEIRKKVSGSWIAIKEIEAIPGKNIKTTLDIDIQDIVESALLKQMEAYQPEFGTAIVMDVKTGDIKAIANLGRTSNNKYWEKYNYAIGELMEPGSTFKLASIMVALEDGVVKLTDTIDTGNGSYKYFDATLTDSRKGGYGRITAKEVFEHSSNIGISKIIYDNYKNNPEKYVDRLYAMSLNETLDLGIRGERKPYIKYPGNETWSGISLPWMSIGYEVAFLPLHTLTFYNAVANDGKMVRPRIVTDIMQQGKSIKEYKSSVINPSICSKSTIKKAQELLLGVVQEGTAMNLNKSHLKIAGKTGTARVANSNKGYNNKRGFNYRASFCGYFPADKPMYSCIVLVESPSLKGIYGNVVAGTVFREIADKIYAQSYDMSMKNEQVAETTAYDVPVSLDGYREEILEVYSQLEAEVKDLGREADWVNTYNRNDHIELKDQVMQGNLMPDVKGMGAKDAIFLLENLGLKVSIKGCGPVKYQSIPRGSRIRKGTHVKLELI